MFVDPLGPTAHATARRTAVDRARQVKALANHPRYRQAEHLNLGLRQSEHPPYASFFRAFPSAEARRLAQRVPLVFTPGTAAGSTEPNRN